MGHGVLNILTQEVVPLRVQVRLIGQTAPHHIQAVVLARLQGHLARTVGAVHHLHDGAHTADGRPDLRDDS